MLEAFTKAWSDIIGVLSAFLKIVVMALIVFAIWVGVMLLMILR